jgi:hypothetical protein
MTFANIWAYFCKNMQYFVDKSRHDSHRSGFFVFQGNLIARLFRLLRPLCPLRLDCIQTSAHKEPPCIDLSWAIIFSLHLLPLHRIGLLPAKDIYIPFTD